MVCCYNLQVLVTVGLDKRLLIIDPTSNSPLIKVSAEVPLSCVHFNDDGVTVAAGTADGRILFYDVRARVWKPESTLQAFKKSVVRPPFLCFRRPDADLSFVQRANMRMPSILIPNSTLESSTVCSLSIG
jgi:WD40 repeat protein